MVETLPAGPASAGTEIRPDIIAALGNTPLVRLNGVAKGIRTPVVAKLEMLNPGGSVKDRIGIRMVEEAERKGWLKPGAWSCGRARPARTFSVRRPGVGGRHGTRS
jgi:hypothetical protein